jgi:Ca2+-binding EF-hand superfamily protein
MILTRKGRRKAVFIVAGLLAAGTIAVSVSPAQNATTPPPPAKREKNVKAGEKEAKKLLMLMDKDQNGKVSKQEFMNFMEAEFERLDVDKNGELDVKELTQARVRTTPGVSR